MSNIIYVPVYSSCSQCGTHGGYDPLGVAFTTLDEAAAFLQENPNPDIGKVWGAWQSVITVEVLTTCGICNNRFPAGEWCPYCNGTEEEVRDVQVQDMR